MPAICGFPTLEIRTRRAARSTAPLVLRNTPVSALLVLAMLLPICAAVSAFGSAADRLPPRYRTWLQQEVNYIISKDERTAFLNLKTDDEREKFMERFWEIRNPTPGAPTNPYKEEHYKRLDYANQYFSHTKEREGWATDMGRIYITLGAPQQRARYVTQSEVRGMEIWFYSQSNAALPPNFSIVFYEKDLGDFRLYSPYMDGPEKLVTDYHAEQGRVQAVREIDNILGREVALTTLSLIPGEPVSLVDATVTLQSDVMLNKIKDLANQPSTLDALNLRRALNENVTHVVVMPGESLNVLTVPLRDTQGNTRLHYLLRLSSPSDFAVAQSDERYYYSVEVVTKVLTPDLKPVFTQDKKLSHYLTKDEIQTVQGRPFGYEGWLPLAAGKYHIEFALTNLLARTSFTAARDVVVPAVPAHGLFLTQLVPFTEAAQVDPSQSAALPFSSGGIKFTPYAGKELGLVSGQDLKIFYQIWHSPASPGGDAGKKLITDYAYGRLGVVGSAKLIHDEVLKEQFDPAGSMINGKKLSTLDLFPGNYRVALTVTDPETQEKGFGALAFQLVSDTPTPTVTWDVYDDELADYVAKGQADYELGLSYLAQGDKPGAARCFQQALRKNPQHDGARGRLVDFYFTQQAYAKVVELFAQGTVTAQTEEQTILSVADSFDKTGNIKKAVDVVESAIAVKAPSGPLFLALASYYQRMGNSQKAEEFERKGKSLMTASPAS